MDDLDDLQARVAAAQEKLRLNADDQRKYGLRLNDVVTIVEGSLARQQEEMKRLQDAAIGLRIECDATRVAESQTKGLYEAALSKLNLLQVQNEQLRNMVMTLLNVVEGRESAGALQSVLHRLESTVQEISTAPIAALEAPVAVSEVRANHSVTEVPADPVTPAAETMTAEEAEPAGEDALVEDETAQPDEAELVVAEDVATAEEVEEISEPNPEPALETAAPEEAASIEAAEEPIVIEEATADESAIGEAPMLEEAEAAADEMEFSTATVDQPTEEAVIQESVVAEISDDMPEDIGEMSMNGHRDFVTDVDDLVADEGLEDAPKTEKPIAAVNGSDQHGSALNGSAINGSTATYPQDEILVSALLDAEKALIEAGASGVANANSPVAEIIRRISLRTREFSEASSGV